MKVLTLYSKLHAIDRRKVGTNRPFFFLFFLGELISTGSGRGLVQSRSTLAFKAGPEWLIDRLIFTPFERRALKFLLHYVCDLLFPFRSNVKIVLSERTYRTKTKIKLSLLGNVRNCTWVQICKNCNSEYTDAVLILRAQLRRKTSRSYTINIFRYWISLYTKLNRYRCHKQPFPAGISIGWFEIKSGAIATGN